jgi:hypothetical protein
MITLKSGICSKDSCISHAKLLGKRARFRVCDITSMLMCGTFQEKLSVQVGCFRRHVLLTSYVEMCVEMYCILLAGFKYFYFDTTLPP